MVKSEVAKIMAIIAQTYHNFTVDEAKLNIWYDFLKDIPYDIAQLTIKKIIMENNFPPSIAEIRKIATDITTPEEEKQDSASAWGEVMKALSNYGHYRVEEALASMTPLTRKVMQVMDFRSICISQESELPIIRAQFLKIYDTLKKREDENKNLPLDFRKQLQLIVNKTQMLSEGA